jgi:DNA-binding CsgD family transcriptional regulator/tetratricopeptide (TPR) repeat protein
VPRRHAFVGRAGELAGVVALVAAAAEEQPGVALVHGEAGAGKTRLLDEVTAGLAHPSVVCRGTGVGFLGGRIPYAPLVAALRSLLARLPRTDVPKVLGPDPGDLGLLLPELGTRVEGPYDQARLVTAVSSVLDRAAQLRPVVLVIDDLHLADVATLEVLAYLCAGLDRQRIAVIGAYRPDEAGDVLREWLQEIRRGPHVLDVELRPMSLPETRAHLTDLLSGDPGSVLGESLTARIHARAGGNPYAAEALMRAALAGDEATLPASLREILVRRTRACRPGTAELLRTMSAAGDRISATLLERVLDRSAHEVALDDAVDEAVRAQLLVVEADGSLSLRHALLAEALYADLLPGERRTIHLRLADVLEDAPDVRPGVVAEHADRAGDAPRTLVWSLRAAQAAEDVGAYDEAHRQYVRVRRLWPTVDDAEKLAGSDVIEVFTRAALIAAISDHDGDAIEIVEGVRSWLRADPDVDPVRIGVVEARYARVLLDAGRTDAALVAARRAVELVPADPPTPERGVVVSGLVHVLDWVGGGGDWEPLADEAVEVARATGDEGALARALVIRTTVRPAGPGVVEDAREAVELALTDGDPELVGQTYSNLVDCLLWAGRGREGVEAAAMGVSAVTARGLEIRYGTWLECQGAELALTFGWWDEAAALLSSALTRSRHIAGVNRDYVRTLRARLSGLRGDWSAMEEDLALTEHLPAVLDVLRRETVAESMLWRGDPDGALGEVTSHASGTTDRLLAMSAPMAWLGARALADVVEARRRTGSGEPGGAGWEETEGVIDDLVGRACGTLALPGARAAQLRVLCEAERARHLVAPAVEPWLAAVAALATAERPYPLAYAQWRLAQELVAVRDLGNAADALRAAAVEARTLGAGPLLAEIEATARRTRIDLRPPRRVPTGRVEGVGATLTAREREILGHLAAGRTNGEIAKALVISTKTASVHVSNILRKLDVSTRYEAAEIADRYLSD